MMRFRVLLRYPTENIQTRAPTRTRTLHRATFAPRTHLNLLTPFLGESERHLDPRIRIDPGERDIEQEEYMAEIRREENFSTSGLSTAALAHADEPAQQEEYSDERSAQRADNRADNFDRGDATTARSNTSSTQSAETDERTALFSPDETGTLRSQWDAIQVGFVDEPRQAVEKADALVAGAMKRLAEVFAAERERLEKQWDRGDSVSTEELRLALRRYRAFFGRLLSV